MAKGRRRAADSNPETMGNVTKASFLDHVTDLTEKYRIKKNADSALASAFKAAERDGLDRKELKRAMADRDLTTDELAVRDRKYAKYREWLNKPVGFQAELVPADAAPAARDPETAAAEERHAHSKAYEEGIAAGNAGADIASGRYAPGTEEAQQFSLGWSFAQQQAVARLGGTTRTAAPVGHA
jgi:hypothetical protein